MTTFYIVRHGETFFNQIGRVQGWCDSPLTEKGIQQAKQLHIGLSNIVFDRAYCSTSERAMDTASYIIGNREIPLTFCKGLKELHFGSYEAEYAKDVFPNGSSGLSGFSHLGGEEKIDGRTRFMKTLTEIGEQYPEDIVLIVTHGSILKEALLPLSKEFHDLYLEANGNVKKLLPNCSVTIFTYKESSFSVSEFGNTSYLG